LAALPKTKRKLVFSVELRMGIYRGSKVRNCPLLREVSGVSLHFDVFIKQGKTFITVHVYRVCWIKYSLLPYF
jgi:hypothetical protein